MKKIWERYGKIGVAVVLLTVAGLFYGLCGGGSGTIRLDDEMRAPVLETMKESFDEVNAVGIQTESHVQGDRGEDAVDLQTYYVHVCGEVNQPGVYALPEGSRIFEAVEAAGGLTVDAFGAGINQAQEIEDGMQIVVSSREEAARMEKAREEVALGLVNLNTATKEQLMTLPGIGEARAEAILRYREESGGFQSIEGIMQVSGIKESAYRKIKDRITI